jgi:hypothetical protein
MIVKEENINKLPEKEQGLVKALLIDIAEINNHTHSNLKLDWIDEHTEWSPERTDPCPDYYGMYRVVKDNGEYIGVEMTLDDLDIALCLLHNYLIDL